jgi:glycine/D-amino acid oxidase-like deaminating enzyme
VSLHIDLPVRDDACVLFSPEDDAFLLPMADRNQWLFSYTRELWDVDPNDTQTSLTAEDLEAGRLVLRRLAPDYLSKSASGRAFCDAYGPSRNPVIARVQGDPKIVYAGAASGSGLRLAPAIASRALALLSQPCRPVRSPEILDSHYAHPLPFI